MSSSDGDVLLDAETDDDAAAPDAIDAATETRNDRDDAQPVAPRSTRRRA